MKMFLYLGLIVVVALSATVGLQFRTIDSARRQSRTQTCQAFQQLSDTFTKLIRDGEKTLPTFAYYKQHPDELAKAVATDEHSIAVLQGSLPNYC